MGSGLLESVYYQKVLVIELRNAGLRVEEQCPVDVEWDGEFVGLGFKADLIVNNKVIVELKAAEQVKPVNFEQTLTDTRLMELRLGLQINFGEETLINGYHRVVNGLME